MKNPLLAVLLVVCLSATAAENQRGAEALKKPVKATIVDARKIPDWNGDPVGNVEVTYEDGTRDRWTTGATAQLPRVAADGVVGWVDCSTEEGSKKLLYLYKQTPVGSRVILCEKGKITAKIRAGKPFIEEWAFTGDGKHVVVKSRAAHGPALVERFTRPDGKAAGSVSGFVENPPEWAKPFMDR